MNVSSPTSEHAASCSEGTVVWARQPGYYPPWPHKVVKEDGETVYTAFGDDSSCDTQRKAWPYNSEQLADIISKAKAKLRNRPETLAMYCEAIEEAERYIQDNLDPSYTLPRNKEVPLTPLSALHSSVFTVGSDSASSPGQGESPIPMGKPRRRVSGKRRSAGAHHKANGDKGGSDSEDVTPIKKKLKLRRSSGRSQPKRLVKTTPTSASGDPLQSEVPLAKISNSAKVNEGHRLLEDYMKPDPLTAKILTEVGGGRGGAKVATPRAMESGRHSRAKRRGREEDSGTAGAQNTRSSSPDPCEINTTTPTTATPPPSTAPTVEVTTPAVMTQATPTALPPTVVESAHIPAPTITTVSRPSPFSSDSEGQLEQDSRSEDDENDLPSVNVKGVDEESLKIYQLSEKDVVWAKFSRWPFWPALVSSVNTPKKKKSKATVRVFFFGCTDDKPLKIRDSKKIAPYKQQDEFMTAGQKSHQFEQAVKEAHDFIQDSAEGKFSGCSPTEIMKTFESLRPRSSSGGPERRWSHSTCSTSDEQEEEEGKEDEEEGGRERQDSSSSSNELSDHEEEEADENCSGSYPYTYDRVVHEIESIKDVLEGVVKGEVESSFHTIYTSGSKKDKERLKLVSRGPIKKWPSTKSTQLLEEVLLKIADQRGFHYALDVLLPEAMVRVKARVENLSREQALAQL